MDDPESNTKINQNIFHKKKLMKILIGIILAIFIGFLWGDVDLLENIWETFQSFIGAVIAIFLVNYIVFKIKNRKKKNKI